ncbi:hypothetical protein ACWEQA_00700 [Nocardia sp. NPDC004085]
MPYPQISPPDGGLVIKLYVDRSERLIPLVTSYGADVLIEEPEVLRDAVFIAMRGSGQCQHSAGAVKKTHNGCGWPFILRAGQARPETSQPIRDVTRSGARDIAVSHGHEAPGLELIPERNPEVVPAHVIEYLKTPRQTPTSTTAH